MFDDSRTPIYDYLYSLFYDVVTRNVYRMIEPAEMTKSDASDGFIVIGLGEFVDESEFAKYAFGSIRAFVYAYVPTRSRGRLDKAKYAQFEQSINNVIYNASIDSNSTYSIDEGSVLTIDSMESAGENFNIFVKSFIVNISNS